MKNRRKQERIPVVISMDRYGKVANRAWEAAMSGKLYLITEQSNQRRKK